MDKSLQKIINEFKDSEASTSVLFGVIVVIIAGVIMFNYFRTDKAAQINSEGEATASAQIQGEQVITLPSEYTVEKGDHLWKIAEKYYGNGYNWVDIAKANKMTNASVVAVGTKLQIPQVEVKVDAAQVSAQISDSEYTVAKGDSLWTIAVRAYGDGYSWTKIWEANKATITNPGLIEVGMKLSIPR